MRSADCLLENQTITYQRSFIGQGYRRVTFLALSQRMLNLVAGEPDPQGLMVCFTTPYWIVCCDRRLMMVSNCCHALCDAVLTVLGLGGIPCWALTGVPCWALVGVPGWAFLRYLAGLVGIVCWALLWPCWGFFLGLDWGTLLGLDTLLGLIGVPCWALIPYWALLGYPARPCGALLGFLLGLSWGTWLGLIGIPCWTFLGYLAGPCWGILLLLPCLSQP